MPEKTVTSAVAHVTASIPIGVTGLHFFGIPLADWAYLAACISAIVAAFSYAVKMWRDIQIGLAAQRNVIPQIVDDE